MSQIQGPARKSSQEKQITVRDKVHAGEGVGDKAIHYIGTSRKTN